MAQNQRQNDILKILANKREIGIADIIALLAYDVSIPTINRDLKALISNGLLTKTGSGKNTVYKISDNYRLLDAEIGNSYFDKEVDERLGNKRFNPAIFKLIEESVLFTKRESDFLDALQQTHQKKIKTLTPVLLKKETERLAIELSWKSSQIEGNTYSLLETEVLLTEKIAASGKDQSETVMLLNHKKAIDYIYQDRISVTPLKVAAIEGIHSLLTSNMGISKNLRKRVVGITGTSYVPPENEFQIREYLENACELINKRHSVFEKAMLAVLFVSYIQPFEDGNKRTGRITGNALLIENKYCPLSYRSVAPVDYKKAMILFYEQNNLSAYKKLFIEQFEFAVKNYF
jgi:Fic family protein